MGQIAGLGYSGGGTTKQTSTPKAPPWLEGFLKQSTGTAQELLPAYAQILKGGLGGDTSAVAPYTSPLGVGYTTALASTYKPTAGAYTPLAPSYQSVSGTFMPGVSAALAPYRLQSQQAQAQLARTTPAGGGREAARGNLLAGTGAAMAEKQAGVAQSDIDKQMGLKLQDVAERNRLTQTDITGRNQLNIADILRQSQLEGQDVQARNALQVQDIQQRNAMMQKLLAYYAQIFGGYNPQNLIGTSATTKEPSYVGIPFANIAT